MDRRFQFRGELDGVTVVDDYAHHPTELVATLRTARSGWNKGRVLCVFQPHLYSRTMHFSEDLAQALIGADSALIMDIYAAREAPIEGITSGLIVEQCNRLGHTDVTLAGDAEGVLAGLRKRARPGDLVLTVGAGDVWKIGERFLAGE